MTLARSILSVTILSTLILLAACSSSPAVNAAPVAPSTLTATPSPTLFAIVPADTQPGVADQPTATPDQIQVAIATIEPRLPPDQWMEWPVVPTVSQHMIQIYQQGIAQGNDPAHFSKIGDCQNVASYFLSTFDRPDDYSLGTQYANLQTTIDHFSGSWSRLSLSVAPGMNIASVLSPIWADPKQCQSGETPLACEIRLNKPSIVIISMETWWGEQPAKVYELYMRQLVEAVLAKNIVPILTTKADNLEGDNSINAAIARVAYDYEVPMWNFWAATQPLPGHGLYSDGFHLTFARNFFDDPNRMKFAWPWRNLTALESIDSIWRGLAGVPVAIVPPATPTLPVTIAATPTSSLIIIPPPPTPTAGATLAATMTVTPTSPGQEWQSRPVVPAISAEMVALYLQGLAAGHNPNAFSKIGDGEVSSAWFLTSFDYSSKQYFYDLGPYTNLEAVIQQFAGSYQRQSMAAGSGFNTKIILDPAKSRQGICAVGETPLDCELRLNNPSFAFVSLGTNQSFEPDIFESGLRTIIQRLLDAKVVPILATKADNLELDYGINRIIVRLADEYHIPLWNFWLAIQPLPDHGLQADFEHLTYSWNDFSSPKIMQYAWPWRNLTALQALDAVWRGVTGN
jgi:hypothetical protein